MERRAALERDRQDNARPHVAGAWQQFLQDEGIEAMDWPGHSPDLNPIEHIRDFMSRSIHQHHVASQTVQELVDALVQETCESILDCTLEEVKKFSPEKKKRYFFNTRKTEDGCEVGMARPEVGLVIDGRTLSVVFQGGLERKFLELTKYCRSVLCCRATPLQKSMVVKLVRDKLNVMTLSIGDGANDVSMIQCADVGIGISGQEGMQAVMSSDFAISRFKHLKKLLLVHGHWCYTRLAKMVIYFFYKNVAYVNLLFWFQFFCGFSGTTMIDYWQLIFFNLIFTSVPPLVFGVLDKDVSAETLLNLPELYKSGQRSEGKHRVTKRGPALSNPMFTLVTGIVGRWRAVCVTALQRPNSDAAAIRIVVWIVAASLNVKSYKMSTFWIAILDAFYQSLICFFVPYLTFYKSGIDLYSLGTPMNTCALFTILLHLAIEIKDWTIVHWITMVGSVVVYFTVSLAYSAICVSCETPSPYWIMEDQMSEASFYLVCIFTPVLALLPRYFIKALRGTCGVAPIIEAHKLDKLSKEEREFKIQEWRDKNKMEMASHLYDSTINFSGLPATPERVLHNVCSPSHGDSCNNSPRDRHNPISPLPRPVAPSKGVSDLLRENTEDFIRSNHRRSISTVTV
ncbi:unnamed protein product [Ranitomeya imitator]|uniref:P-type phospholipid transporter n=1 Tax=Ranitomeya imitator TaxID=111125 RepID=A0ABN9L9T7_9NEOB|nr:unnamed protein product [Ranitomeya imitator]